jgi:diguanylate cyclase (GGDEF)-like protein
VQVTASLGVATQKPGNRRNLVSLLVDADRALYQAKADGRNRGCITQPRSPQENRRSA